MNALLGILFDNIFQIKANLMNNEWSDVVNDINIELRRPDKLIIQTGSINKVIVSDNWILQVGQWPWNFNLAHKSNVQLELVKSVHLVLSPGHYDAGVGFSTRPSKFMTPEFTIPLKFGTNPLNTRTWKTVLEVCLC